MKKLLNLITILLVSNLLVNTIVSSELEKRFSERFFKALHEGKGSEAWDAIVEGRKRNITVVNLPNEEGETALFSACINSNLQLVNLLLEESDTDPNLHPENKVTPFIGIIKVYARLKRSDYHNIICSLLNDQRTDLDQGYLDGTTPLMLAIAHGMHDIAKDILVTQRANLSLQHQSSGLTAFALLCTIIDDCNKKEVKEIIEIFFTYNPETFINIQDTREQNLLHIVLSKCVPFDKISFLLDKLLIHGINVNSQSIQGKTPLMLAIERKNEQAVKILLSHPAIDLGLVDVEGNNALMIASIYYHPAIYKLIEAATCEKIQDAFECTNNDGFNYQQLIPDYVKQGAALIKQEAIAKKKDALQKKAQQKKSKEEQNYLDQIDKELDEQTARESAKTVKDMCSVGNESSAVRSDIPEYHIEYTKACNRWMHIAKYPHDSEVTRLWLGQNGYFKDPSKEQEPIKSRALYYQKLIKSIPAEEAILHIVSGHNFPKIIDRTIINNDPLTKESVTENTDLKITVPATYTNGSMIHEGQYELFYHKTTLGNYAVYHRVFKETNVKVKPEDTPAEKATDKKVASGKKKAAATGGADAQGLMDDRAAEDQFKSVSQFLVLHPQTTKSKKNTIHTIIDQKTQTTYTITLPNH